MTAAGTEVTPETLADWLAYIERQHPKTIELGLDRVERVKQALALDPGCVVITVGGTNGKGSTCAMLEAILTDAGYSVGCYTSPHLIRYNERVRINRVEASDAELCAALAAVETARGDTPLTYFEFGTLAAIWLFARKGVDAAVLEVGLGGRLDAVNVFDADVAVLTSVALDHMDYLGDTREAIGYEKAGIFRHGHPAIVADPVPPASVVTHAAAIGANLYRIGCDFGFRTLGSQWSYFGPKGERHGLPYPALRGSFQLGNAAACLAALDEVKQRLPVTTNQVRNGLLDVRVAGRFQVLPGTPTVILDVAHNPHAAEALAANLRLMPPTGRNIAVFAMLSDKDIRGVVAAAGPEIALWVIAGTEGARGAPVGLIAEALDETGADFMVRSSVVDAYRHACFLAAENDRIIVFGSFHTVGDVLRFIESERMPGRAA